MKRRPISGVPSPTAAVEHDVQRRGLRVCLAVAVLSLVYAVVQAVGAVVGGAPLLGWVALLAVTSGLVDLLAAGLVARGRLQAGMAVFAANVLAVLALVAVLVPEQVVTVVLASLVPVVFSLQFLSDLAGRVVALAGVAVALQAMVVHGVLERSSGLDPRLLRLIDLAGGTLALVSLAVVFVQARGVVSARSEQRLTDSTAAERRRSRVDLVEQQQRLTSEFVQLVSHELRTPLSSILGYTELMQDAEGDLEPADRRQMLAVVGANARRLDELVADLLDIARLDAGQLRLEYGTVDAAGVLDEVADVLRPLLDRSGQTLQVDVPRPVRWQADARRVEQVVTNLVSNAHKYSPEGSLVQVRAVEDGGDVVLTVRDQGIGMDDVDLGRLFTKFFRAPRAQAQSPGGTGLGLVLCSYLVHLHGGTIQARSEPGVGSTFTVRLPLTPPRG